MNQSELDKLKDAWQKEKAFTAGSIPEDKLQSLLKKRSKDMRYQFRSGIISNILVLALVLLAFAGLIILYREHILPMILSVLLFAATTFIIILLLRAYRNIPADTAKDHPLQEVLQTGIDFYRKRYRKMILLAAISNPMVIISGSMYFFFIRYGGNRTLDIEDLSVFGILIILAYVVGAFFQLRQFSFFIRQLKEILEEMNEETLSDSTLQLQKNRRKRRLIISIITLVVAVLLLAFLILKK